MTTDLLPEPRFGPTEAEVCGLPAPARRAAARRGARHLRPRLLPGDGLLLQPGGRIPPLAVTAPGPRFPIPHHATHPQESP
ncbi:hypothetical protein ACWDD9_12035 [Kitasatospora sp. NPDC001119]